MIDSWPRRSDAASWTRVGVEPTNNAAMVPYRPFGEPMVRPLNRQTTHSGAGMANIGAGAPVGKM